MRLHDILLEGSDTHKKGLMVGFWVPPLQAEALAQPGGEPPDELHVTLAYMGKGLRRTMVERIAGVCAVYAAMRPPLSGRVASSGKFPATVHSDGLEVLIAKPDVPGLMEFREGLVRRLKNAGAPVKETFDFCPHITLAYIPPGNNTLRELPQVPLRFQQLVMAVGGDRRYFTLGRI